VFSRTLAEATWPESSVARGDLAEEIAALRAQPGGEIIAWGGAGFAQALSRARTVPIGRWPAAARGLAALYALARRDAESGRRVQGSPKRLLRMLALRLFGR